MTCLPVFLSVIFYGPVLLLLLKQGGITDRDEATCFQAATLSSRVGELLTRILTFQSFSMVELKILSSPNIALALSNVFSRFCNYQACCMYGKLTIIKPLVIFRAQACRYLLLLWRLLAD